MAHFEKDETAALERRGVVGPQAERFVAVGERRLKDSDHRPRPAAVVEGGSEIRFKLDRLVVIVDGAIVVAPAQLRVATVEVSLSRRLELDRLIVIRNGAVVLVLAFESHAAIVVSPGELRVELDRLVVVLNGAIIIPLKSVTDAAIVEGLRQLLASIAGRFDNRRTTVDTLIDRHRVLALAPGPLVGRLCERRRTGQQAAGDYPAQTLRCQGGHRQLHPLWRSS